MGAGTSCNPEVKKIFEREKRPPDKLRQNGYSGDSLPTEKPEPQPAPIAKTFDEEATERMRSQLDRDANAFLLNNLLLSVQFFDNFDKQLLELKNNPVTEVDTSINENLTQHHKHVCSPDKMQEAIHRFVRYLRPTDCESDSRNAVPESLYQRRMFVVHDNIDVSEPGDESDYSTVVDTVYYKMLVEDSTEPGYVKLQCMDITQNKKINESQDDIEKNTSDIQCAAKEILDNYDNDSIYDPNEDEYFANEVTQNLSVTKYIKSEGSTRKQNNIYSVDSDKSIRDRKRNHGDEMWKVIDSNVIIKLANNEKESQLYSGLPLGYRRRASTALKSLKSVPENIYYDDGIKKVSGHEKTVTSELLKSRLSRGDMKVINKKNKTNEDIYNANTSRTPSSGYDSDYDYTTITNVTTPKPLEYSVTGIPDSTTILPNNCLTPVSVKANIPETEDESDEGIHHNRLYLIRYYLNGKHFMANFVDLFLHKIGYEMRFSNDSIKNALGQGASIYCDIKENNESISYEVLPSVYAGWSHIANEWLHRSRRIVRIRRTNFMYQWPLPNNIEKARSLGCLLLPIGHRPTRGSNEEQSYQWKICFPAVERYLETCLAHSQVRCYMFTLCLIKTFLETDNAKLGLDAGMLKSHLFMECEDNFAQWPEDRLGEKLRNFLTVLNNYIKKDFLPCYFIPKCNLLKSIPKSRLLIIQRQITNILESPVPHMLVALQNLHYTKQDFYPVLDYIELYKILISNNPMTLLNPNLQFTTNQSTTNPEMDDDSDSDDERREKDIRQKEKHCDQEYNWRIRMQKELEKQRKIGQKMQSQTTNKTRKSKIDTKIIIPKRLELAKRRLILELFIPHFIKMAEYSFYFKAAKQSLIYLEHADRLCTLLSDEPSGEIQAQEYKENILEKKQIYRSDTAMQNAPHVSKGYSHGNAPSTPQGIFNKAHASLSSVYTMPTTKNQNVFTFADVHKEGGKSYQPQMSFTEELEFYDEQESRL